MIYINTDNRCRGWHNFGERQEARYSRKLSSTRLEVNGDGNELGFGEKICTRLSLMDVNMNGKGLISNANFNLEEMIVSPDYVFLPVNFNVWASDL